jgi:isochorismate synthase
MWNRIAQAWDNHESFAIGRLPHAAEAQFFFLGKIHELVSAEGERWFTIPFDATRAGSHDNGSTLREDHHHSVKMAIQELQAGVAEKVVISKIKSVPFDLIQKGSDIERIFAALSEKFPSAFTFFYSIKNEVWIGATPEILLEKKEQQIKTVSLAGTRLASGANEDWGQKERHEQQVVTDFIANTIKEINGKSLQVNGPFTVQAAHLEHLKSEISFESELDISSLVKAFHPTPAVCGLPREAGFQLINRLEKHDRGNYAGVVGWTSAQSAHLFVQLRCARIDAAANKAYIFSGGGIMKDSVPEKEWEEAENKANVMLNLFSELASQRK